MFQRSNQAFRFGSRKRCVRGYSLGCLALAIGFAASLGQSQTATTSPSTTPDQPPAQIHPMTNAELAALSHDVEAVQSKQLLELATALELQLRKTSEDTLSVEVIRRANQIEHLARSLKERSKMKFTSNLTLGNVRTRERAIE